jgi:RHS repeat-associated protein
VDANPFRYRGYYYDKETKLYYLNSRYYDPETSRFISPDKPENLFKSATVPFGANLYQYCYNNPVMYTDSTGQFPFLIFAIAALAVGLTAGATVGAVTAYNDGLTGWDFAQRVITKAAIGTAIAGATLVLGGVTVGGLGGALGVSTALMNGLKTVYAVGMLGMVFGTAAALTVNGIPFQWDGARFKNNDQSKLQVGGNKALDHLYFNNPRVKPRVTGVQMLY